MAVHSKNLTGDLPGDSFRQKSISVKFTSLQLSFCASVAAHGLVFGIVAAGGFHSRKAAIPGQDGLTTLTLLAAPPANAVAEITPPGKFRQQPELNSQSKPQLIEEQPVEKSPELLAKLNQPIPPVEQRIETAPVVFSGPASPASDIAGDRSSAAPGEDATTAQVTVVGARVKPKYLKNQERYYPLAARRQRQEGTVLLSVKVSAQGTVSGVALKKSSAFLLLDEAAANTVRGWQFEPARVGSLAVESEIEVPVQFRLTR